MPWLTPNVFKQGAEESLARIPRFDDGPRSIRFRHVVHPYTDKAVPDNNAVQQITFETIRQAIKFSVPEYRVDCVAVTYPEDAHLIPSEVIIAPHLDRFATDIAKFATRRDLPLLFDILGKGASADTQKKQRRSGLSRVREAIGGRQPSLAEDRTEVEFLVMTNSDIHVQPYFYRVLADLIGRGYEVITTNRRTIDADRGARVFSPIFMADRGADHAGFDCFVFPMSMIELFVKSDCCCGAGHVMRSLLFNLVAHARRFLMLTHAQLTYHLGNDEYWGAAAFLDYVNFNILQAQSVLSVLIKEPELSRRLSDFVRKHEIQEYISILAPEANNVPTSMPP